MRFFAARASANTFVQLANSSLLPPWFRRSKSKSANPTFAPVAGLMIVCVETSDSAVAKWTCISRANPAIWTARFVSIASALARTTTSAYWPWRRAWMSFADPQRSSVGRLSRRSDIAALALVFVFAAFANAAFMTAPVVAFSSNLAAGFGLISSKPVTAVLLVMALVLAPATVALAAAYASRAASGVSIAARELLCRFSLSLVPLGAAMWAGHFLFHLFVGWGSGWTTFRRAANSLGWPLVKLSEREFSSSPLGADAVRVLQTILLDAGFLLALYLAWRICLVYAPRARDALSLFAAWAGLATILYAAGVWIILQPMEMRGLAGTILPP